MLDALRKIFKPDALGQLRIAVAEIGALEPEMTALAEGDFPKETGRLKEKISGGAPLDEVLPRAFALAREAAKRVLGQRPYDVQMLGGMALHKGAVAEMMTGEGKTLSAVAPAYLNALAGRGVHVVTVNEYLARRDAAWMGRVYRALGLSVSCLVPNAAFLYDPDYKNKKEESPAEAAKDSFIVEQEFLRPISRREAYLADITYGTNHEFGFDYLRDNLAHRAEEQVQFARRGPGDPPRGHNFAIIDEADSILIDEARTPLIIAAPDVQSSDLYKAFARLVRNLEEQADYHVDEKLRTVSITDDGITKVEKMLGMADLYGPENLRLVHYLEESLKAKALFRRDKEYVVKNSEVIIVDEFTGRLLHGRRYQAGLHQAIEAKEGVPVKEESKTYAKISIQNYFRLYEKISGMTGTAQTSAEEFHKVYKMETVSIPPNRPCVRADAPDLIYKTAEAKWRAVVSDIKRRREAGQPVLVGTTSIEKNELVSRLLSQAAVPHEVLNAKNNEREGAIIAQAGRPKAVTVATNMAGRGVDIILGGNPPSAGEAEEVRRAGGLHVLGTERHEARRIDNQLRGRSGRQGDPGSSQFYLSLEDDLMRIFGGDRIKALMDRFSLPEDQPIDMRMVSKAVAQAQSKVEGANFDMRKHLLEYDDVLNKQRAAVYRRRQEILTQAGAGGLEKMIYDSARGFLSRSFPPQEGDGNWDEAKKLFADYGVVNKELPWPDAPSADKLEEILKKRSGEAAKLPNAPDGLLGILDLLWMTHLEDLEALSESIGLRAYGQHDPLSEYRQEAHRLFKNFWGNFDAWVAMNMFRLANGAGQTANIQNQAAGITTSPTEPHTQNPSPSHKVGRNDPCPCGAVNPATNKPYKYKHCGLINAPHHKGK